MEFLVVGTHMPAMVDDIVEGTYRKGVGEGTRGETDEGSDTKNGDIKSGGDTKIIL